MIDKTGRMTVTQFAAHLGVHHSAVQKAIQTKRITSWERDDKGRTWIDQKAAAAEWARNTDPVEAAKNGKFWLVPPAGVAVAAAANETERGPISAPLDAPEPEAAGRLAGDETDYQAARTKREQANAQLAQLELLRELGVLVPRADVEKAAALAARVVRDAILSVPDRLAPLLAAETDATRIYAHLDNELRHALNGLADRSFA